MKLKSSIFALALTAASVLSANSATLAQWDTDGFTGTETTIAASNIATGLTATSIGLGSGIGTTNGGGGINTNGWASASLFGADGNFYGFSITVLEDYEVSLTALEFVNRASNTGPRDFALRSSIDAFSANIDTFSTSGTAYIPVTVDLTSLSTLTEGTYEFRAVTITTANSSTTSTNDFATGGTYRIMNVGSTGASAGPTPITLSGDVTLIPEPTTALLGGLGFLALLRRRR